MFDEVSRDGIKIAAKNNRPICVLLSLEKYGKMVEEMELMQLGLEADSRLSDDSAYIPFDDVLARKGLTKTDLDAMPDVEFE